MESYIVHIYRRQRSSPYQMVGVVEEAESNHKRSFHTAGELLGFFIGDGSADIFSLTEKRSADRLDLRLPVKVSGVGADGCTFNEEAVLENIGTNGATLSLKARLDSGSELKLIIDPDRSNVKKKAKVVRIAGKNRSKKQIGVSFSE